MARYDQCSRSSDVRLSLADLWVQVQLKANKQVSQTVQVLPVAETTGTVLREAVLETVTSCHVMRVQSASTYSNGR